jgi:long-chain acyl-CoA synthetase
LTDNTLSVPAEADDRPWVRQYPDGTPWDVDVPDRTLYESLAHSAREWPTNTAISFMGRRFTFAELAAVTDRCAAALAARGLKAGDSATVILPNTPHVIVMLYALNRLGVRCALAHPLSAPDELAHYITETHSTWAVTLDMFYGEVRSILDQTPATTLVVARIPDYLSPLQRFGFRLTRGRKIKPVPADDPKVLLWSDLLATPPAAPDPGPYARPIEPDDGSVILFSGGTTDLPKGIELTSANFNALAVSIGVITGFAPGSSLLAILPTFHGFGLGICIHAVLSTGGHAILVPEFSPSIYINNLRRYQPHYIAGVPTLFEALMRQPAFAKVDFSRLLAAYCGADSLTADLKHRFDERLIGQGATTELVEGYGLTECVTACVVSPKGRYRENSMGVPMPSIRVKIVDPETGVTLPYGEEGEICITGPTLMKGYVNDPEATAQTLRVHDDGRTWLHSGDIGTMDSDGYLYFLGRLKRLIKVSGVSVYPAQVEQVLEAHPSVNRACVIAMPSDYQMSSIKAFIVLHGGVEADDALREDLLAHCRQSLMRWAIPRVFEFRDSLPMTLVGKIAYTELEKEG